MNNILPRLLLDGPSSTLNQVANNMLPRLLLDDPSSILNQLTNNILPRLLLDCLIFCIKYQDPTIYLKTYNRNPNFLVIFLQDIVRLT